MHPPNNYSRCVPRSSSFRAALAGLLTAGLACIGAQVPASAAPADDIDPLLVHIDTIDPVLPKTGDVEITGTVTNVSQDTYTRINLHAFSSETPILSSPSLVSSAASEPGEFVGPRVTEPGTFYTVAELAPGQTAYFSDSVPVELLAMDPNEEGVYWIGVHAFGDGAVPRDGIADGRARTFIPARPSSDNTCRGLGHPLDPQPRLVHRRGQDRRTRPLGTAARGGRQPRQRARHGRLRRRYAVQLPRRPGRADRPAPPGARQPARSIAPDPTVAGQEPAPTETASPEDGASESADAEETLTPPTAPSDPEPTAEEQALKAAAGAWFERFKTLVGSQPVLTLPFGDLDVSAAVRNDPIRYDQAVARSTEVMGALADGIPSRPAVAPADDALSPEAIQYVAPDAVILLGDSAFDLPPETTNSVVRMLGHKLLVTSTAAESGGPGPTAATDPLALRQRLISEAALRTLDEDPAPLIVTLPASLARGGRRGVLRPARAAVARRRAGRGDRRRPQRGRTARVEPELHGRGPAGRDRRRQLHGRHARHRRLDPAREGPLLPDEHRGAGA